MAENTENTTVRIYIVRHGETDENKAGVIQGHTDTRLNGQGRVQAEKTGERLKDAELGIAFTSDLDRAVKTAEAILCHHPNVVVHKDAALRERKLGELEGMQVGTNLGRPPEGMESYAEFRDRAIGWWKDNIEPYVGAVNISKLHRLGPRDVLITTHGGFVGVLLRTLVNVDKTMRKADGVSISEKCHNGSVSVVEVDATRLCGILVEYSDISHLAAMNSLTKNADVISEEGPDVTVVLTAE